MDARFEAIRTRITRIKDPKRDAVSDTAPVEATVKEIIANIRERGNAAVHEYSRKFDRSHISQPEITQEERLQAVADLTPQMRKDTEFAIANVRTFARAQFDTILPLEVETLPGLHLGHRVIPIEVLGAYVKICTHQWLEDEGVAAVAPPAVRQSASEGLEGHRRAAALRLTSQQQAAAMAVGN